ncbi:MAG: hypothetical protein WA087_01205 [Candidatus Saccharimonadales bacterium]
MIDNKIIKAISDKGMDRKDFLKYSGLALLSLVGLKTIANIINKKDISNEKLAVIGSTSGTNTGDETQATTKIKLGVSSTIADGYLTSADWNTFNNKQPAGDYLVAADISGKVDIEAGKGLSTNDYDDAAESKLAGIADGAEVNVNADWDAVDGDAQILNKPTIPDISGKENVGVAASLDANYLPLAGGTLTGTVTISGTAKMNLLAPALDHSATGMTTNAIQAGATIAAFQLVFLGTGGKWLLVDADAVATCKGLIGIALESQTDGNAMATALPGSFVRDDTWNWTIGDTLFAGETPGTMQNTIPTGADAIIKVVGFAVTADMIYFNPSPDQQSIVA